MTKDDWEGILQDLGSCSEKLEKAARELTHAELDMSPDQGGWSIRQIIHHLADGACIWGMFIHQALSGVSGEFNLHWYWAIPQEEWAEIWNYSSRDIAPSLAIYRANQERLLGLLRGIDNPTDYCLEIRIRDNDPETVSVREAVRILILHLKDHLSDIRKILQQRSG